MSKYKGGIHTMNMKRMTQKEFDEYVVTSLIPEIQEEHGSDLIILLTDAESFKFAKECELCHDYILLDKEYDIPKVMKAIIHNREILSYLEVLTGLDVYELNEVNECECYDDDFSMDEEENYYEEICEVDLLSEDAYDDYDEY